MARSIHNVDFCALIMNGGVFGKNGDAAFALQIAGVHYALDHRLIFAVDSALLEHFVDQRGFAVIDMGNDRNITDVFLFRHGNQSLSSSISPRTIKNLSTNIKYNT